MGMFRFFKGRNQQQEEDSKERYWSLTTDEKEIIGPTWEQIQFAVEKATPEGTIFASLGYMHSGLEIEIVQAVGDENGYRFEALVPDEKIYVKDGISQKETVKLFEHFFKYQRVAGYRSCPTEKI